MKNMAIGFVLGLFVAGGICAYNAIKPSLPSILAPPSKELINAKSETLDCRPVVVYKDRVKRDLGLPETVKKDPDKKVTASTKVLPSDYPNTVTSVYDTGTGMTDLYIRRDSLPWLAFNRRMAIGAAYGVKDEAQGFVTRVYGRIDLLQIKRLHAGILGDVDNAGGWYGGAFVEGRW